MIAKRLGRPEKLKRLFALTPVPLRGLQNSGSHDKQAQGLAVSWLTQALKIGEFAEVLYLETLILEFGTQP